MHHPLRLALAAAALTAFATAAFAVPTAAVLPKMLTAESALFEVESDLGDAEQAAESRDRHSDDALCLERDYATVEEFYNSASALQTLLLLSLDLTDAGDKAALAKTYADQLKLLQGDIGPFDNAMTTRSPWCEAVSFYTANPDTLTNAKTNAHAMLDLLSQ